MRTRVALAVCLAALAGGLAACGDEDPSGVAGASVVNEEAVEGEPLELGELTYNVQITRFLNPDDTEDSEYLRGQPPPPEGRSYLGVFVLIENETEDAHPSATDYVVFDTLDQEYQVIESESPYALEIGAEVPAEGQIPIPNTTAATGPNHASLMVFLVDDTVSDNRPLRLEISSEDGSGDIILDI